MARGRLLSFIVVARTPPGDYPHPVEVALHPDGPRSVLSFSLGPHAANVGGQVPVANVVDPHQGGLNPLFQQEFDAAELHWLVPFLVRLQAGDDVSDEVVDAYRALHGRWPASVEQSYFSG